MAPLVPLLPLPIKLCAATLLPIVNNVYVTVITIIHSDEWAAYNRINTLLIAQPLTFINPTTGTHTQHARKI